MDASGVSNEMLLLYEAQRRSHETILALQAQIEEEEAVYLEETPHGNIIRGWDGFIDSKQPRKDANPKKIKPYTESEHLFSNSCCYSTMASEPSLDQLDFSNAAKDENPNRRKLTVTLSVGKGTGASGSISGVVESATSHCTSAIYKGSNVHSIPKMTKSISNLAAEKGGTTSSYQASKLKKRKKETETSTTMLLETVSAVNEQATIETMTATTAATAPPPASDFLDVL